MLVAERLFESIQGSSKVSINITYPVKNRKSEWTSSVNIFSGDNCQTKAVFGIDSMQALFHATELAKIEIANLNLDHDGKLTFLGQENLIL